MQTTTLPVSDEESILFGVTWHQIFQIRDRLAQKYFLKFSHSVPLEELHSAGNEAIAELRLTFTPNEDGKGFVPALYGVLRNAYHTAYCREHRGHLAWTKGQTGSYTTYTKKPHVMVDIQPWDAVTQPAYDDTHDLGRIASHVATLPPRDKSMLLMFLDGMSDTTIAAHFGICGEQVGRILKRVLLQMQAWAFHGSEAPPSVVRAYRRVTPANAATIARLHQEGATISAISRRVGQSRRAVYRVIQHHQPPLLACAD